jgi:hypothetical protein
MKKRTKTVGRKSASISLWRRDLDRIAIIVAALTEPGGRPVKDSEAVRHAIQMHPAVQKAEATTT